LASRKSAPKSGVICAAWVILNKVARVFVEFVLAAFAQGAKRYFLSGDMFVDGHNVVSGLMLRHVMLTNEYRPDIRLCNTKSNLFYLKVFDWRKIEAPNVPEQ
jgi:hypothetical protein